MVRLFFNLIYTFVYHTVLDNIVESEKDDTHIHTSLLVKVTEDEQRHCLLLITCLGNNYCLVSEDISTEKWEKTEKNSIY